MPPHASHLRAQIVFENQRQATLGMNGLTKIDGRIGDQGGGQGRGGFPCRRLPIRLPAVPAGMTSTLTTEPAPLPRPASPRPFVTANGPRLWSTWALRLPSLKDVTMYTIASGAKHGLRYVKEATPGTTPASPRRDRAQP